MDLTATERDMFVEMRMLTTDMHGVEILVGLTPEESVWYVAHARARMSGERKVETAAERSANADLYLSLHDRMKLVQMQVLGAEHVLDTERPTRN